MQPYKQPAGGAVTQVIGLIVPESSTWKMLVVAVRLWNLLSLFWHLQKNTKNICVAFREVQGTFQLCLPCSLCVCNSLLLQRCIITQAAVSLLFNGTDIHATQGQSSSKVIGLLLGFIKGHSSSLVKTHTVFKIFLFSNILHTCFYFLRLGAWRKWACLSAVCHMTVSGGRDRALP